MPPAARVAAGGRLLAAPRAAGRPARHTGPRLCPPRPGPWPLPCALPCCAQARLPAALGRCMRTQPPAWCMASGRRPRCPATAAAATCRPWHCHVSAAALPPCVFFAISSSRTLFFSPLAPCSPQLARPSLLGALAHPRSGAPAFSFTPLCPAPLSSATAHVAASLGVMAGYMGAENGMQLMNHPGLLLAGPGRGTKLGRGVPDPAAYAHKLFIGQIPYEAVEQDLWALFSAAGDVLELAILRSQGRSKGCAFLTYATREQVGVQIAVARVQRAARRRCTAVQPQRAAGRGRALLFGGGEPRHGPPACLLAPRLRRGHAPAGSPDLHSSLYAGHVGHRHLQWPARWPQQEAGGQVCRPEGGMKNE